MNSWQIVLLLVLDCYNSCFKELVYNYLVLFSEVAKPLVMLVNGFDSLDGFCNALDDYYNSLDDFLPSP